MFAGVPRKRSRRVPLAAACAVAWFLVIGGTAGSWALPAGADTAGAAVSKAPAAAIDTTKASPSDSTAAAPRDTAAAAPDTTAQAGADSSLVGSKTSMWTIDELKRVIDEETGGLAEGEKYRERKSGRLAMACAILVPGLGQMYNEKPLKAALAAGLESFYVSQIAMNRRLRAREKVIRDTFTQGSPQWNYHDRWVTEYWERSVDWIWWSGAVILGIVIDAYVDAKLDDMRFKVEPRAADGNIGLSLLVSY